jgi:hypothetical protein
MCSNVKPVVVSGTRPTQAQPSEEPPSFTSERYLDCFCPSCWHFQDFRHNKDTVRDWSFMRNPLASGKKIEEPFFSKGLKGPLTDTEMQKVVDFYLKINKAPGPDKFQAELIKTMPPEQIRVLQIWLNEILAKGELVTKVTEAEMAGRLALLHKGGYKSDQISH